MNTSTRNTSTRIAGLTTWRGTRRTVVGGTLGAAAALPSLARAQGGATPAATPFASPFASPAAGGTTPHLLVADREVNAIYVYSIPGFALTGRLDNVGLGIHAGSLLLEDGRLLFADTLNEELVTLVVSADGVPEIAQRVTATFGGNVSWISADPTLARAVAGSLIEDGTSQFLNVLDLERFENTAIEFAMAEPEEIHGWLLGEPTHLHVAVGGRIDSYPLSAVLAGGTEPTGSVPVDLGSHGGATDAKNRRLLYTTGPGNGFDVLDAGGGASQYLTQIPWDVDGLAGGRNARPRMLRDGVHVFGVMTPGLDDPSTWADTTVSNHVANMDALSAVRLPIATGTIGYRWGLADDRALWAGYDAEGATAYVLDADPASGAFGTVVGTIAVAKPSGAAVPGQDYAESEFYLMTALTPDGRYGFVTVSGDGLIQALDLEAGEVVGEIRVPSPLAGGGYTTVVQAGIPPVDLWAR